MKIFIFNLFNTFLCLCITFSSLAQLSLSGNLRNRGEFRYGQGVLPDSSKKPAFFVNQRTRLMLDYNNPKYLLKITIQDSRVWGDTEPKRDNGSLDLFEAWIKYYFTKKLSVKLGRQRLIYDDQRLLSETNWNNKGSSHDLAVIQYENTERLLSCHLGLGLNNLNEDKFLSDYNLNYYKYLSYLWIHKKLSDKLDISLIDILDANQKPAFKNIIYIRNTAGTNVKLKPGRISAEASVYIQHGNISTGEKLLSNFYAAKFSWDIFRNTSLILGYDHYSGTDLSDSIKVMTKTNSFSKLYGSNHRFLGYMDYFGKDIASENNGAGINNINIRIENTVTKSIRSQITWHWFALDKEYLSATNKVDKYLGTEIDLMLTYKASNDLSIKAGYSFMLPNNTLEIINEIQEGKSRFAQFGWLQIQFNPILYSKTK
ncbi:MAG: alginate export family protein [Bacteroidales bacterium]|nr:MAG: alginate export family protein [Bacteroidales bacterium]